MHGECDPAVPPHMTSERTLATVYENCIPAFVAPALERLYQNVFSSLPFLRLYCPAINRLSTYVASREGEPAAILLFELAGSKARVFNEGFRMDAGEASRFASHLFSRYPSLSAIFFNAIRPGFQRLPFPVQKTNCSEDIVVPLPPSVDAYLARLGRSTRKNIRRYMAKLERSFPSAQHEVFDGADASERHLRAIIGFNRMRMAAKGKVSTFDEDETRRLIRLVRECGLVSIVTVDGRICAGEICSCVGSHYFAHVGGHDPLYDDYRLGTLSCYLAIAECIRRGGSEFHFLWGQYDYKFMLAGVQHDLERVVIYRSRAHVCFNGGMATQLALGACLRKLKASASGMMGGKERSGSPLIAHLVANLRGARRRAVGTLLR